MQTPQKKTVPQVMIEFLMGSTSADLTIHIPSLILGSILTILTSLLLPILKTLIGEFLFKLAIFIKYCLIVGGVAFLFKYFILNSGSFSIGSLNPTIKFQESIKHTEKPLKKGIDNAKVAELTNNNTIGSFRYFDIPITKLLSLIHI